MLESTHIFHRSPKNSLPTVVSGHGVYLVDSCGKEYLDACGGAAVSTLGHGHPRIVLAVQRQVAQMAYTHSSFFTTEAAEQLSSLLVASAPANLNHVYFVSGGSEAVESALKLARQYFVEIGQPQRSYFISRRQSYHGNTLGALAIGGNAARREPFLPILVSGHHVSPCYAYRDMAPSESEEQYAERLAKELEDKILELGGGQVAAFVAETVVGATAGALTPVRTYFERIREVCDRYGVLLILDEVMCGMGRTGTMYACEQDNVVPDLLVIAKGLGAGYQPIGAMLVSDQIYKGITAGSGSFQHGFTYNGHATACAAALEVQRVIKEEDLLQNVKQRGEQLRAQLQERFARHLNVGDIRGRGLMIGLELVADKFSKAPLDASLAVHARIKQAAMQHGLMIYPMGGTIDGKRGDHVLLAPAFIIGEPEVDQIVERLAKAVADVLPF